MSLFKHYRILVVSVMLTLPLQWGACASTQNTLSERPLTEFVAVIKSHPDQIWSKTISLKTRDTIKDYKRETKLKTGEIYGYSVRTYDLRGKCAKEIDMDMQKLKCLRKDDVLKNPDTKQPLLTTKKEHSVPGAVPMTIPMISYLCLDGGVVRLKPEGDPTSKFKPQPLASKALRYPFDSKFENFDDEIVKVDNDGNVIPKWIKDLNVAEIPREDQSDFIKGWADDAHTDLKMDCKNSK